MVNELDILKLNKFFENNNQLLFNIVVSADNYNILNSIIEYVSLKFKLKRIYTPNDIKEDNFIYVINTDYNHTDVLELNKSLKKKYENYMIAIISQKKGLEINSLLIRSEDKIVIHMYCLKVYGILNYAYNFIEDTNYLINYINIYNRKYKINTIVK
jgi:hypothetical protein